MLRPVWLDLLGALGPPLLGVLALLAGTRLRRLPGWFWRGLLFLVVGLVLGLAGVYVGARLSPAFRDWSAPVRYRIGGAFLISCPLGLLLLGVVWSQPGRSMSSGFLLVLAAVGLLILTTESTSRLWWRWLAPGAWNNRPDSHGCVQQSSGFTCGPAATAMLLSSQGIAVSEGELAYRTGTSLWLGSDLYGTAAALTEYLRPAGKHATVERIDYQQGISMEEPFVASVDLPGLGGHALYVERLTPEHVHVVDPRQGQRTKLNRQEFEAMWEGWVIRLRSGR